MNVRTVCATATAMGLLMGAAWAGSGNTLYISQNGDDNIADVKQTLGNNSDVGQPGNPATQNGSHNRLNFTVTNWGTNNNNDIVDFKQDGTWNLFEAQAAGGSSNNALNHFLEQGAGNSARVMWTQNSDSRVDHVAIRGDKNTVSIYQGKGTSAPSNYNYVGTVVITGSNNGIATGNQWAHADSLAAVHIDQVGFANRVTQSAIVGSNNHDASPWSAGAFNKVHEIIQKGNFNGQGFSVASTNGSDGNWIRINQDGDWNDFQVYQGSSTSSTQNHFQITQNGSHNSATGTQYGSYNNVSVDQDQDGNVARINITGDNNGSSILAGPAATLANTNGLTSGLVKQDGLSNTATLDIIGSNNNQFAFLQSGNANSINGMVIGGSGNSATVVQNGNGNSSTFTQSGGGGNIVAVNQ